MTVKTDAIALKGIHHIEFWVGNAKQAEFYYRHAFGFSRVAYSGPETGVRDRASYVMAQGKIRLVLTTPLYPDHPGADHIRRHGDGVCDIAFEVDSVDDAHGAAVARGGKSASAPGEIRDAGGAVRRAGIHTYGDTTHSLIEKENYTGPFLPGYVADEVRGEGVGLLTVDHMVGNVELGHMDTWAEYYEKVWGFHRFLSFDDKDISTEYTALMSKVMSNGTGRIKFPLNEPAAGKKKSQIEEYLDFYHGPGVQHVAMLTGDIIATVSELRRRGVEFLEVPETYYDDLRERGIATEEPMAELARLGILVDSDEDGYLLQLFTKPVEDRPTLFYEIIQRKGSQSFGKGNFKALFEAIEREQGRRGNL